MLIKYLKDTHDSVAGDVKEIPDEQANILNLLEVSEPVKTLDQLPVPENVLINLNGTPVIDDFGSMALKVQEIAKPTAKTTTNKKKGA